MELDNAATAPVGPEVRQAAGRLFRTLMWGYLFFLPIANIYLAGVGWVIVLLGLAQNGAVLARARMARIFAVAGLVLSCAGPVLLACRVSLPQAGEATLRSLSLLMAAAVLYEACRLIIGLAEEAGNRLLPQEARTRALAFVVYAVVPFLLAVGRWAMTPLEALAILAAYLVAGACVITLVMALLASAANLCRAPGRRSNVMPQE
jgi:hypothetical protein